MKWIVAVALLLLTSSAQAQDCVSNTGNNATVFLPNTVTTNLEDGDLVRVYYSTLCVGEATYISSQSMVLMVWGEDPWTEGINGIPAGELIDYSVTRPSTGSSQDAVTVSYEDGATGHYQPDAVLVLNSFQIDGPLPVELTSFDAVADGQDVHLRWTTSSETNNAGFEVQRLSSMNDSEWDILDFVQGAGTTLETQVYSYSASSLQTGKHIFRLKQVDFDGSFEYSPQVEVNLELPELFTVSEIYPNPFNPEASFSLTLKRAEDVTVRVYDAQGRLVQTIYQGQLEANTPTQFQLGGSRLPSGTYFVHIQGASFSTTRQAILLK